MATATEICMPSPNKKYIVWQMIYDVASSISWL